MAPQHDNHDEDDEIILLLQQDKSPSARAIAKMFMRQRKLDTIIMGDEETKQKGVLENISILQKGFTYLAVITVISLGVGVASCKPLIGVAIKLLLP